MKRLLLFSALLLLIAAKGYSQGKTITGTVTDKSSAPLEAVTVSVVETQKSTLTNLKGQFTLVAQVGETLKFSYIGAKPYIYKITSLGSPINIQLEVGGTTLNEVVVTGYQSERKKDLTGAVSVVNLNDIKDVPAGNPMKALEGRVPGLSINQDGSPNGSVSVKLRGITTLGSNDPLYIIDGIPTQRGLQEINQSDIESIQILKDASSATIYGSRAAAGVIIITTKKGKKGTRVDFDASSSLQFYTSKIKVLDAQQHAQAYWQASVNDHTDPNVVTNGINTYNWNGDFNNPVLSGINFPQYIDAAKTMLVSNTNWFNEISQNSVLQSYNLSISNGGENGSSYFSVGYFDNKGIIKETRDTKYNVRFNTDYNLFKGRVKVGENFSATFMKDPILPTQEITDRALLLNPVIPVYTVDGGWGGPVAGMDDRKNPYMLIELNKQNVNSFGRVFGNAYVDVAILHNLHFKTQYSVDYAGNYFRAIQLPYTSGFLSDPSNTVSQSTDYSGTLSWQNTLNYDATFGKHKFTMLLGEENVKDKYQNFNGSAKGLAINDINYAYLSEASNNVIVAGGGSGDALISYFAKANYTYNSKYLFSATLRRDGSSKFGPNNSYALFPAASAGWRLSEEEFFKNRFPVISDLKLRVGWGQTGNQNIDPTAIHSLYKAIYGTDITWNASTGSAYSLSGAGSGTLPYGFTAVQTGNPDLKWETTTQTNYGIDFGLFNNKVVGSVDYYIKDTKDILFTPGYLAVLGDGGKETFNGASMQDKGVELIASYNTNINQDLSVNLTGNFAVVRNKVTSLPETVLASYPGNGTTDNILGRSINSEYGYVADGLFTTMDQVNNSAAQNGKGLGRIRYADLNHDGVIDDKDRTFLGTSDPDFTYGLNTSVSYKGFSLSFFFQGVQGGLVYNTYKTLTDFSSIWPGSNWGARTLNAWTPQNPNSTIPALTRVNTNDEGRYSSYFLESGSYLKLRNIQFSYNLKSVWKTKLQRANIYVQASNLLRFQSASYTGPDVENPSNAYPIPVVTTIGVNFSY